MSLALPGRTEPITPEQLAHLAPGDWVFAASSDLVEQGSGLRIGRRNTGLFASADGLRLIDGPVPIDRIWQLPLEIPVTGPLAWAARTGSKRAWRAALDAARAKERTRWGYQQLHLGPADWTGAERALWSNPLVLAGARAQAGAGLFDSERRLFERWLKPGLKLLDVGCGAGREAFGFAELGLDVLGLDLSPEAIEIARAEAERRSCSARFEVGDATDLSTRETFDALFIASDVYASIQSRTRRIRTLSMAATRLVPGGMLIMPVSFGERSVSARLLDEALSLAGRFGVSDLEPGDRIMRRAPGAPLTYRHRFRSEEEITAEIRAAGLDVVERASSWFVAKKPRWQRPRADLVTKQIDDQTLMIDLAQGQGFRLNGSGAAAWRMLESGAETEEIIRRLSADHPSTPIDEIRADVHAFLVALSERGLLEGRS